MTNSKLTDTQRVVLAAAGARGTGLILPLPKTLRNNRGTIAMVLRSLLSKGFVAERPATPDEEAWDTREHGIRFALIISKAGLDAIGIEEGHAPAATGPQVDETVAPKAGRRSSAKEKPDSGSKEPAADSKLGILIAALRRKKGALISELMDATGWQAHSVRGAISGALKKKLGFNIVSESVEGRGRVYRIGGRAE